MAARYYSHHYEYTGVTSTGFSIPLTTGSQVHRAIELILGFLVNRSNYYDLDIDAITRSSIDTAIKEYEEEVDACDLSAFPEAADRINDVVSEQTILLEGLVWCWRLQLLPWIMKDFEVVAIETEFERMLSCDCGLGVKLGDVNTHNEKGCNGLVLMTRPDIILRKHSTGKLVYVELKTGSDVQGPKFAGRFEENVQFVLGAIAAEHFYGEEMAEFYVHGLHKGYRGKNDNGDTEQKSILCYPFVRDGVPPMIQQDISPEYYKMLPGGEKWGCTLKRGYIKTPIWKFEIDGRNPAMSKMEHYVKNIMTEDQRASVVRLIGPIPTSTFLTNKLVKEMVAEEGRWKDRIYYIREAVEKNGGNWDHPEVEELVLELIPRSWNCKKYGQENPCEFIPKCHEHGIKNLLESGHFVRRNPNHPIEKELGESYGEFRE